MECEVVRGTREEKKREGRIERKKKRRDSGAHTGLSMHEPMEFVVCRPET